MCLQVRDFHYSRVLSRSSIFSWTTIDNISAYFKCIVSYYRSPYRATLTDVTLLQHTFFFTRLETLGHFSRGKSSFWTAKIHEIFLEDTFSQFRIVKQTYLRTKIRCYIHFRLKIGKTLRHPENINKSDHLLLYL